MGRGWGDIDQGVIGEEAREMGSERGSIEEVREEEVILGRGFGRIHD